MVAFNFASEKEARLLRREIVALLSSSWTEVVVGNRTSRSSNRFSTYASHFDPKTSMLRRSQSSVSAMKVTKCTDEQPTKAKTKTKKPEKEDLGSRTRKGFFASRLHESVSF